MSPQQIIDLLEEYKVEEGLTFDELPPPDVLHDIYRDTEITRRAINTVISAIQDKIRGIV